jgi:hypothetical protein
MPGDLKKALKLLGVTADLKTVMTDKEVANLIKMPAKKATPILLDALAKAKVKKQAAEIEKALKAAGLA